MNSSGRIIRRGTDSQKIVVIFSSIYRFEIICHWELVFLSCIFVVSRSAAKSIWFWFELNTEANPWFWGAELEVISETFPAEHLCE